MSASESLARSITLAVIAGGAGSRMGVPKAWLTIGGKPILEFLLDRWSWEGPKLLISSPERPHPPAGERFDREVFDSVADQGPLRGLVTALEAVATEIVIAVTCDMPLIERGQLLWLAELLMESPQAQGVFLVHQKIEKIEPFPCALRTSAAGLLRQRLEEVDRSVYSLAGLPQFLLVTVPESWPGRTWINLNSPVDFDHFVTELASPDRSE